MIRTLAYFENFSARNSREPMQAMLAGAKRHGIDARPGDLSADAAVIWSVLWAGRMRGNQDIYRAFRASGRPVIVMDVGTLSRNITWKVALNHINAEGYFGHDQDLDHDRPARLGIGLASPTAGRPEILIACQHAASLQMKGWDTVESWLSHTVDVLRQHTDRHIVARAHPRSALDAGRIPRGVTLQIPRRINNTYDDFDMSYNYHAVVNHCSGPGIQAALAGTRPLVHQSSLAYPVAIQPHDIELDYDRDRQQWLIEISHTEYTVPELAQGMPIQRLKKGLHG